MDIHMDVDEKLVRKLIHLAYRSKKNRIRKKYKNLMFEMMQRQIDIAYEESLMQISGILQPFMEV